jgi:Tol biopolymer transport system component
MNADGSDQRKLTGPDEGWYLGEESYNPAWSPDSRFIVYAKREPDKVNLWIMRADGTEKRRLTSATSEEHIDPAWSPDGSTITFRRSFGQHVVMQRVLAESGAPLGGQVQPTFGRAPSYSPDGKWIAYMATDNQHFGALKVMPGGGEDWPRIARDVASRGGNNPAWIARP